VALDFLLVGASLAFVGLGHLGLWLFLYNRINATGLPRRTLKLIEKGIVLACVAIPITLLMFEIGRNAPVSYGGQVSDIWRRLSIITLVYSTVVCLFAMLITPFWISDRPQFADAQARYCLLNSEDLSQLQRLESNAKKFISGSRFRKMAKLPGNQIVSLQRNRKQLRIEDLPSDLIGLRIAHLSDVHLTGQLSTAFYRLAMDWLSEQSPDLIVVSGDIVDYATALEQLIPVFEGLSAPLGMYFVLGNHDKRLPAPTKVCDVLCSMGWTDLGRAAAIVQKGVTKILLVGNELPWFRRHETCHETISEAGSDGYVVWKLGVSHSPDQFPWGVSNGCRLLLCGHTHGGQIRLPLVGPVIAPSHFGTRYASGVFLKQKTLMHVSRGISGVHPFRWGCIPEVTILELAKQENRSDLL